MERSEKLESKWVGPYAVAEKLEGMFRSIVKVKISSIINEPSSSSHSKRPILFSSQEKPTMV
jgi:hypothetical protein